MQVGYYAVVAVRVPDEAGRDASAMGVFGGVVYDAGAVPAVI